MKKEQKEIVKADIQEDLKSIKRHDVKFGMVGRIMLVGVTIAIVAIILASCTSIPMSKKMIVNAVRNNVYNLAIAYGTMIEMEVKDNGQMPADMYENILKDVSISGYDTSYAYLVDSTGIMKYHPTASKIGNKVENAVVTKLVEEIGRGIYAEPAVIEYDFKGTMKIAGYYISAADHSILVVTLDKSQVEDELNQLYLRIAVSGIGIIIISCIGCFLVAVLIAKPLKRLKKVAEQVSDLDLTENADCVSLSKRGDEAGLIARAMLEMRSKLSTVVSSIAVASEAISKSADLLNSATQQMNENSSDNSATSEELAASMQETAATTDSIDGSIAYIEKNTGEINKLSNDGGNMAKDIKGRAEALKKASLNANEKTLKMYQAVKEKTEVAIEQSKSVEKIQNLTDAIMAIASQTSLLSLNASIEAARAGEMGRGFAVVAGEIGNLASQSTSTVNSITQIVAEVQSAVANMTACLMQTLEFLENTVTKDYGDFIKVGDRYNEDAASVEESMNSISASAEALKASVDEISTAISGINATIGEAATGVSDIAEKTSRTVELTADISTMIEQNAKESEHLSGIVNQFKL